MLKIVLSSLFMSLFPNSRKLCLRKNRWYFGANSSTFVVKYGKQATLFEGCFYEDIERIEENSWLQL